MAEAASASNVAGAIKPPEYRKAVQAIRTIKAKKEKIGRVNEEIGEVWGKVEGYHVNKVAAKFFAKLDALEPADRADILRSFNGLADASGWPATEGDLVDEAQGNVVHLRLGTKPGGGDDGAEGEAGGDDDPPLSREEALERSRQHLGTNDDHQEPGADAAE